MSKEVDALRAEMLTKLRAEKAETAKQLEKANAAYRDAEAKLKAAQAEFLEASRLVSRTLKDDMEAAKEVMAAEGRTLAYNTKPKPPPEAPKHTPAHRRIVRVRNAAPPPAAATK